MEDFFKIYWDLQKLKSRSGVLSTRKKALKFSPLIDKKRPSEAHRFWLKFANSAGSILDYGAGDLRFKELVLANNFKGIYKTLDIGGTYGYDYAELKDVDVKFDLIYCFEVIEHMELDKALDLLRGLKGLLNENGLLILSTPNIHHINHFWRTDITHKRPYPYEDLAAMLLYCGFSRLELFKIVYWRRNGLLYTVRFWLRRILTNILKTDYATNIAFVCRT